MNNKKLWLFKWSLYAAQCIGIFKATDEEVEALYGETLYFGEIEGKHSEVYGRIERGEITLISDNPVVVNAMPEIGYNPIEYLEEEESNV